MKNIRKKLCFSKLFLFGKLQYFDHQLHQSSSG